MASKEKRAMAIINRDDSTFDRILANFKNPEAFPLTEKEQEQLDRWHEAFTLMLNHWPKQKIVERWGKEKSIKPAQAYADIRNAEIIFGNVIKADREGYRAKWLLWAEDYLLRCKQKGDRTNEAKALLLLGKYAELDKQDDKLDTTALTDKIEFTISEDKLKKALEKFAKGGTRNFNNLNVIDIDAEEVDERGEEN